MTRGVPRLNELLKATKNPKATELSIPLRRDLRDKKEEARRVAAEAHGLGLAACDKARADSCSMEEAETHLVAAEAHLQDATGFALLNWGHVHLAVAALATSPVAMAAPAAERPVCSATSGTPWVWARWATRAKCCGLRTASRNIPMAVMRSPPAASRSMAMLSAIRSSGSCSTQPGLGKCWLNSRWAVAWGRSASSKRMARVDVVPWSSASSIVLAPSLQRFPLTIGWWPDRRKPCP
jgi:peptidoglycan/xylan/chitin deacetylase (PgdA/CDA1 family)